MKTEIIGNLAARIIAWSVFIAAIAALVLTIAIISATAAIYIIEWDK